MEIPRLEEAYLRAARGLVKQSEATLMMKEIGWRRLKEEVKSLTFWKQRAQSLEESLQQQGGLVEELTAQNRLHFARYQALLVANAARDRKGSRRAPESAQAVPTEPVPPAKPAPVPVGTRDLQEELLQLRAIAEHKDATIQRLSRQLSRARACPLLGSRDPVPAWEEEARPGRTRDAGRDIFRELDAESSSSSESSRSSSGRRAEAARLQQLFMARIQARRAESAPHIQAIRRARSFGT
mmetsp:Transcript_30525/g.43790  ORF Transcript_30525/g.43790 Transcript_30525/m.43790 type:complete len:240 (+) Transcript_30525:817-1536(+)